MEEDGGIEGRGVGWRRMEELKGGGRMEEDGGIEGRGVGWRRMEELKGGG